MDKKERDRLRYLKNRGYFIAKATKWHEENPEKYKKIKSEYDQRNQAAKNARTAKYRAAKVQATPKWLSQEHLDEIRQIYKNCPPGLEVDHIVPIRGKNVRGLHVPWNLQYLSPTENNRKNNRT